MYYTKLSNNHKCSLYTSSIYTCSWQGLIDLLHHNTVMLFTSKTSIWRNQFKNMSWSDIIDIYTHPERERILTNASRSKCWIQVCATDTFCADKEQPHTHRSSAQLHRSGRTHTEGTKHYTVTTQSTPKQLFLSHFNAVSYKRTTTRDNYHNKGLVAV